MADIAAGAAEGADVTYAAAGSAAGAADIAAGAADSAAGLASAASPCFWARLINR